MEVTVSCSTCGDKKVVKLFWFISIRIASKRCPECQVQKPREVVSPFANWDYTQEYDPPKPKVKVKQVSRLTPFPVRKAQVSDPMNLKRGKNDIIFPIGVKEVDIELDLKPIKRKQSERKPDDTGENISPASV